MEQAINSAITMFHISRIKEVEYWRHAKEHSKEVWEQGKQLKGIDPHKEFAMSEKSRDLVQQLLSQEHQEPHDPNVAFEDPNEYLGWEDGNNLEMEEHDTDRRCTRCGTKTQICDECLDNYCAQCERSGECPYCG
eukprot:gene25852-biopygen10552